jgi:hypothetical protein
MYCSRLNIDCKNPFHAVLGNLIFTFIFLCSACPGFAANNDWAEGTYAASDGAIKDYYNRAAGLKWNTPIGDWCDADDVSQGSQPYAADDIQADNTAGYFDVVDADDARMFSSGSGCLIDALTAHPPIFAPILRY